MSKPIETSKQKSRISKASLIPIPSRETIGVPIEHCEQSVKDIICDINKLQHWSYETIKPIFKKHMLYVPENQFYKKGERKSSAIFVCKYRFASIPCNVMFVFHFENVQRKLPKQMIVLGGTHVHEGVLVDQRTSRDQLRSEIIDLVPLDNTPARQVCTKLQGKYPTVKERDVYAIRNQLSDISLSDYLNKVKEFNKDKMIVDIKEKKEPMQFKPKTKRKYIKKTKKQSIPVTEMDIMFQNWEKNGDVNGTEEHDEQVQQPDNEIEIADFLIVESFYIFFPVFFH